MVQLAIKSVLLDVLHYYIIIWNIFFSGLWQRQLISLEFYDRSILHILRVSVMIFCPKSNDLSRIHSVFLSSRQLTMNVTDPAITMTMFCDNQDKQCNNEYNRQQLHQYQQTRLAWNHSTQKKGSGISFIRYARIVL
jgi:hypothetical protein